MHIVITRPKADSSYLMEKLIKLGHSVSNLPVIKIQKLETDYLVIMVKEKQTVDKFIIPSVEDIFFYVDKYLERFYGRAFGNTTRSIESK